MTTSWGMLGRLHTPRVNRAKPSPYAQKQASIFAGKDVFDLGRTKAAWG